MKLRLASGAVIPITQPKPSQKAVDHQHPAEQDPNVVISHIISTQPASRPASCAAGST
jgi:hypothetical protein